MERAQGMTWKDMITEITKEFLSWGCRYSKKQLPEIAMGYDCTPLFFWNWIDDLEAPRTERGFLRVLGYAWRKHLQEEEPVEKTEPIPVKTAFQPEKAA